ncbi:MAG: nucleoside-diphosphate kinase [Alphaproteobacteria bacterium]|nr:nucleoside-diphosphate kinase [Alphaproteobacteria bacterium]
MAYNYPEKERTLIILKPDAIQRVLMGEIISRFEKIGLKIVALKMVHPTESHVRNHYEVDPNWVRLTGEKFKASLIERGESLDGFDPMAQGEKVLQQLITYMASGPVVACVLEGGHAIALVRKMVGGTNPLGSDVGTIRGDYVIDSYQMADKQNRSVRNLIHASGNKQDAEKEISIWFTPAECLAYDTVHERILYSESI